MRAVQDEKRAEVEVHVVKILYCADGLNDQINMFEFLVPDEERFVLIRQSSFPRHIFRMVSCSHGLVPPMLQSRINTNEFLILKKCRGKLES